MRSECFTVTAIVTEETPSGSSVPSGAATSRETVWLAEALSDSGSATAPSWSSRPAACQSASAVSGMETARTTSLPSSPVAETVWGMRPFRVSADSPALRVTPASSSMDSIFFALVLRSAEVTVRVPVWESTLTIATALSLEPPM